MRCGFGEGFPPCMDGGANGARCICAPELPQGLGGVFSAPKWQLLGEVARIRLQRHDIEEGFDGEVRIYQYCRFECV